MTPRHGPDEGRRYEEHKGRPTLVREDRFREKSDGTRGPCKLERSSNHLVILQGKDSGNEGLSQ